MHPDTPPPVPAPAALVTGTLVSATATGFTVDVGTGTQAYALGAHTQVCDGTCSGSWRDLHPGDRVEASVDGSAPASWVNVNPWADDVEVDAIDGDRLSVHSSRHPQLPPYLVVVGADTRLNAPPDGTGDVAGALAATHVGDGLYVVGSTESPGDASVVLAGLLSPLRTS